MFEPLVTQLIEFDLILRVLLSLLVGLCGALVFSKLKLSMAFVLGPLMFVLMFQMVSQLAYFPIEYRLFIQAAIGTYIGLGVRKEHLRSLKGLHYPVLITFVSMLVTMVVSSFLITWLTDMNLVTAIFATIPGGVFDMAILSIEFDADITSVAIMQMIRLVGIVVVFPFWINRIVKSNKQQTTSTLKQLKERPTHPKSKFAITLLVGLVGALVGYYLNIPAGPLSISMFAVAFYNLKTNRAYSPLWFRKTTQIVAGTFLATQLDVHSLAVLVELIVPAIIMLVLFLISNLLISKLLAHYKLLEYRTALFATSPAGAAEMAMLAHEFDDTINMTQIALMHIIRLILVISVFPILIKLGLMLIT